MRFVCVFEANHACVCAGQSKTGSIVKAFETLNPANIYYIYIHNSSTAQGGGGSFKNRTPIGEIGGCESPMAERSH